MCQIIEREKRDAEFGQYEWVKIEPFADHPMLPRFGIDPGIRNMGFATLKASAWNLYQVKLKRIDDDPLERMLLVWKAIGTLIGMFSLNSHVVIENASFGHTYRQVHLAEMRAAAILWFYRYQIPIQVVPPQSVRKNVFGSAKIKAKEEWSELPPDAAAALACALYQNQQEIA